MFGLKWLWEDSKTLKCHLFCKGLVSKNSYESLRYEKLIIFRLMVLRSFCVFWVNAAYKEYKECNETQASLAMLIV